MSENNEIKRVQGGIRLSPKKQEQIGLGVETSFEHLVSDAKFRLLSRQNELELKPFWKYLSTIMAITSNIFLALLLVVGGGVSFTSLPPEIPLYYDHSINTWYLTEKSSIFFFALFYILGSIIFYRLVFQVFKFDKRLANVANWLMFFINLLTFFAIGQIVSLIS